MFETFIILLPWIAGILGLIVGSFLNVVIIRFDKKSITGRSGCMSCGHQLHWYELIPVVSFLLQKGKCRSCKKRISSQYPLVEIATAILFYLSTVHMMYMFPVASMVIWGVSLVALLGIVSYIVLLITYDVRFQLVPHIWLLGLIVTSVIYLLSWYASFQSLNLSLLVYHGVGLLLVIPFLVLWLVSKGKWMGFGDILLIVWLGIFFGLSTGLMTILVACYLGGLFGLGMIIWKRFKKIPYAEIRKIKIPFVPFLLGAWLLVELLGVNLFAWFL